MRTIERTTQFKRDFKRESRGLHRAALQRTEGEFMAILHALLTDAPLPERCCDHALGGQWKDFRDCHVKPDLILLYRKPDATTLQLVRLGSHSELGF